MNKKVIISASAGVVVLAVLGVYFFAVPAMQVSNYKQIATTKHSELNDSLNKLGAILESDTFVKTDIEPSTVRSDVKRGTELAKNVDAKLELVKKDLTNFNSLPLLGFNSKYVTAESLKNDEATYISKTEAFVSEMKQVLTYMDKSTDLTVKFTDFSTAMEKAGDAETMPAFAAAVDKAVQDIQPTVDAFSKLTPPASLKEGHEYTVKAMGEMLDLCKQASAAARASDASKLSAIGEQMTSKGEEITKKSDEFNAKFIRESELRKLDDALNQLDRDISRKQASL